MQQFVRRQESHKNVINIPGPQKIMTRGMIIGVDNISKSNINILSINMRHFPQLE